MQFKTCLSILFVILTGWYVIPSNLYAQDVDTDRYTILIRDLPTEEALEQLVALTKINLIYDPKLLDDARVYCNLRGDTAESILRCITTEAGLDFYQLSSGTYVVIEKPQEAPKLGDLAGIVVDIDTGEPLPYANVLLADAATGTATNNAGMFSFSSLLPGEHALVTTYIGYETAYRNIVVPPDGNVRERIGLKSKPIVSAPIVVNGLQQRLPSEDLGVGNVKAADFENAGGQGTDDVIYSVNAVMNVGVRTPFVDLHIQGGEAGENLMLLDGVPVFEPVSLGRLLGAFSPLAIGRLTVHKAGFNASIGSQISGVLSAEQRIIPKTPHRVTLQVDPLSVNGRANFSFDLPGQAKSHFMIAGRSSVWDLYQSDVLNNLLQDWNTVDPLLTSTVIGATTDAFQFTPHRHGSEVSFSDLHAAGLIEINPFHKVFLSFYQGKNNMASELLTSESAQSSGTDFIMLSRDQYRWNNSTAQIRHEWLLGARVLGTMKLRNSLHTLAHNYQMTDSQTAELTPDLSVPQIESALGIVLDTGLSPDDRNRLRETALEAQIEYSPATAHHVQAGIEISQISHTFSLQNPFFVPLAFSFDDWRFAGFVQDKVAIGLQTSLEFGSRFTYIPDRQTVYAEPRLSLRYDVPSSPVGPYALHLGAGMYRQFINQFDLSNPGPSAAVPYLRFWLPIDETLAPPTAYHLTANLLFNPEPDWTIRFESYYKDQPRILALHYHPLLISGVIDGTTVTEADFIQESEGYAYGGGVFIEHQYKKGIAGIQYSYSNAKRRFPSRFDGRLETTPWNEPHRLSLSHDFFLTPALTTRFRAHGIWGRAWAYRQAYYDYLAAHAAPGQYDPFDLTNPSNDKLPAYYQIDAGIAYEQPIRGVSIQLRADVLNLLNRRNEVDWSLFRDTTSGTLQRVERTLPGITTALSLRVMF